MLLAGLQAILPLAEANSSLGRLAHVSVERCSCGLGCCARPCGGSDLTSGADSWFSPVPFDEGSVGLALLRSYVLRRSSDVEE